MFPVKLGKNWNMPSEDTQFKTGDQWKGNSNGRPKGKTLKEFAREFLMSMTDEQKEDFLNGLSKDVVWKMAEGNPHNTEDITSGGKPIPLLNVLRNPSNEENNSTNETN